MPTSGAGEGRPLADRLRPTRLAEIVGNSSALGALRTWAASWEASPAPPRQRAALLEGPPGVGKTSAALALAAERGWTVVEMNASDARNQAALEAVAGRAAITHTLGTSGAFRTARDGGRTLILLDEADSLSGRLASSDRARAKAAVPFRDFLRARYGSVESLAAAWGLGRPGLPAAFESWDAVPATAGRGAWTRLAAAQRDAAEWREGEVVHDASDRGGLGAIARLVRETRQPVVLTVNDPKSLHRYSPVFRSHARTIRFEPIRPTELKTFLRRVAVGQGYPLPGAALDRIIERSRGDLRAALNDLEAIAPLPPGTDLGALLGGRDTLADVADFVEEALSHPRVYRSVEVSNRLDAPPDDLLPWVEEAVVRASVPPGRRAAAIDQVALADRLLFRARRRRVFSQWSYATETLAGAVGLALQDPRGPPRPVYASFPRLLGAMGQSKGLRATRQDLLTKVGHHFHLSRRKATESMVPLLEVLFRSGRSRTSSAVGPDRVRQSLVRALELTEEELAILTGLEPDHPSHRELLRPPEPARAEAAPVEPPPDPEAPAEPAGSKRRVQRRLGEY
jgi:replication factor C large subunit